jgi:hypothetical protein
MVNKHVHTVPRQLVLALSPWKDARRELEVLFTFTSPKIIQVFRQIVPDLVKIHQHLWLIGIGFAQFVEMRSSGKEHHVAIELSHALGPFLLHLAQVARHIGNMFLQGSSALFQFLLLLGWQTFKALG